MSSSLFDRFHEKKSKHKSPTESLAALQPPPRHLHRRMVSSDRKWPLVINYSPKDVVEFDESITDASMFTDDEMSEDESPRSRKRSDNEGKGRFFDTNSKVQDFTASAGSSDPAARSRGPLMRLSQSFGRASERSDPTMRDGRRDNCRAARQSAKYDVAWRQDDESACCQTKCLSQTSLKTPRRACVACCTLLQAMARAGDDRVEIVKSDVAGTTLIKRHFQSAPVGSTCHSPTMPAPAATPRYRDRLAEVRRVMAAGKLSRRRGSSEKKMYVISSRWLRNWVAFTSSASSSNLNCDLDYGFDADVSTPASNNDDINTMGRAPGPIDNLSLLELSRGKLVRRPGLIRDNVISGDAASAGEDADFQLLSPEVWEVFQRLYGGAPAIYVNLTSAHPMAWIIDVSDLLTAGSNANDNKVQMLPAVDRALTARHMSEDHFCDLSAGSNQAQSPTAFGSDTAVSLPHTPVKSRFTRSKSKQQPPESPVENGDEQQQSSLSIGVNKVPIKSDEDMRATTSASSPTAAYAASAFAVAMKQARLNAQKAIDDRASRVITA
ncbi:unnamed protein product [Peronospora destructor]|uniref:DUSP domain-containing protein n=1 Tax=Peronospora destructor TaxID=86335 RepID=A0AAV0UJS0_9STRA|nr:unnamed protein product [Peronospora destructor]